MSSTDDFDLNHRTTRRLPRKIQWLLIAVILSVPATMIAHLVSEARATALKSSRNCRMKQLGLATHNFHDVYGAFPAAFTLDENGAPMHSWRVGILPYLEARAENYDITKRWDAPENRQALAAMPDVLRSPAAADSEDNHTSYAGVFGPNCIFRGSEPVTISDITDGTSNTLMIGEVLDPSIPWAKPEDIDVAEHPTINHPGGFGTRNQDGCFFLLADGSVKWTNHQTDPETLSRLFQRNDGQSIDLRF